MLYIDWNQVLRVQAYWLLLFLFCGLPILAVPQPEWQMTSEAFLMGFGFRLIAEALYGALQ